MLKERFEDVCDDPMAELKQLQETNGIVEYHERFELIKTRVNLSEEYLVSAYLAGLRMDTQMHVRMFQPQTVRHCLLLGRLYEKAHPQRTTTNNRHSSRQTGGGPINKQLTTSRKENPYSTPTSLDVVNVNEPKRQPRKFLSQEEMSSRRAKGLC